MAVVTVPYSEEAIEWAKENCPNYHSNILDFSDWEIDKGILRVKVYFVSEHDATLFALRWCQNE
jgi:hypothetical protein